MHGRLPGFSLSAKGKRESRRLAKALSQYPISVIYTSPLERAYQTAAVIANSRGISVQIDTRLIDIKTPLEGKPLTEVEKINGNFYLPELIAAGGERLQDISKRIHDFIEGKIQKHRGKTVLAVTHGDLIMCVYSMASQGALPEHSTFRDYYVPSAGGFVFIYNETGALKTWFTLDSTRNM